MPQAKHHPVYVVRLPNSEGCGHQHSHRPQAWNCADNIAHKRPGLSFIEVWKIRANGNQSLVGRVRKYAKCTECGGMVFNLDDGRVTGHYEDCKVAS